MPLPLIIIGSSITVAGIASWLHKKKKKQPTTPVTTPKNHVIKPLVEKHQQDIRQRRQETDKDLQVSLLAMGTTGLGWLVLPSLLLIAIPLTLYSSAPIFRDAWSYWREKRKLHSSIIDSVAVIGTVATGYYFSATVVNSMYFLGQKVLLKTEDNASQNILELFSDTPRHVWLLQDGVEVETLFEQVKVGHTVVIYTGESIPFDGSVVAGTATVDQHMLTGEAQPQEKTVGDEVFASTVLIAGQLNIRVDKAGKDTVAAQIGEVLQNTLDFKSAVEARSTRVANQLTLPTLALSGIALGKLGPVGATAIANCNFSDIVRITIPLGVLNHLKIAAQQGILIKDGRALELLAEVNTVVFDKTGTLTQEKPEVTRIHTCHSFDENQVLALAATVEHHQTHPVARAILEIAAQRGIKPVSGDHIHYELGYGIRARIQAQTILLGSQRFMESESVPLTDHADWHDTETSHSLVYLAVDGELAGVIELQAKTRPEIPDLIRKLQKSNLQLHILSGDQVQPTRQLAESLGIKHYQAQALPQDKARYIETLQAKGHKVCFIGDGINDAIAMKKAEVAISMAGATTVATDAASIVLLDKNLQQLGTLFDLAKGFDRNIKSGMAWSLLPGIVGIGAVFLLHMRVYGAVSLYLLSLGAGAANSALPLLKHKRSKP